MSIQDIAKNRTTLTLYRAIFELLTAKKFDDITVNDICQTAMVSRSTFYSYFADKYELIIFCLQQEREKLGIIKGENVKDNILTLLNSMQQKKEIFKNILTAQTNLELRKMIVEHTSAIVEYNLSKSILSSEQLSVATMFSSSGISGTVLWWVENDFHIEPCKLAEYLYQAIVVSLP